MARRTELWELTRTRVLIFLREPEVIFWVFFFPLALAAALGFAFRSTEAKPSRVGVLPGAGSAALVARLGAVEDLEAEVVDDPAEAEARLRRGVLDGLLEAADPPRLRLDPNRPEAELTRLRVLRALEAEAVRDASRVAIDPVLESGSRYVDFLFPGLLGMNLMSTGMWLIGFAVAELRQRKLLKRMLVTPMSRVSFLFSFLLARLVFLVLEVLALLAFGVWVLGVPFRSDVLTFLAVCMVGAVIFAGLGMLSTARVKTIQGASGMLNVFMLPMWLFSGVFFSYERFPEAFHPLLRLLPLSALNDALRAVILDGTSLVGVSAELLILAVWGAVSFFLALKLFRWG